MLIRDHTSLSSGHTAVQLVLMTIVAIATVVIIIIINVTTIMPDRPLRH